MFDVGLVVTLLGALLTGGFLMLFIESQKMSSSVTDRFQGIMEPFYHKLSFYLRFVALFRSAIVLDAKKGGENIQDFEDELTEISRLCVATKIPAGYYSGDRLEDICLKINNFWYYIDHKRVVTKDYIKFDPHCVKNSETYIRQYIAEVNIKEENSVLDLDFFARFSGDFYEKYFVPIRRITYEYEHWLKRETCYKYLSLASVIVTLLSMLLIIFIPCLCPWVVILLTVISSLLLIGEVFALIRLDKLANDVCRQ